MSVAYNSHVQPLSRSHQNLDNLSIHADLYHTQSTTHLPRDDGFAYSLWILDLCRLDVHLCSYRYVLEPRYQRTLHGQKCILLREFCSQYRYRYHHLCFPNAIVEAIATSQAVEDRAHVCVWIWLFVRLETSSANEEDANLSSVCITSMIRLKSLYVFSKSTNDTLQEINVAVWSGIEINVAIACSSLPALQPLLARIIAGIRRMRVISEERPPTDMTRFMATDPTIQPHQLKTLERMAELGMKWDDIQVQKEIFQQRNSLPNSADGIEMVEWKADCYSESLSEELKMQGSNETA